MADVKICDRCGEIFENKNRWIYVHPDRYVLKFIRLAFDPADFGEYETIDRKFDLCPTCMADLDLFLKGRPLMGKE